MFRRSKTQVDVTQPNAHCCWSCFAWQNYVTSHRITRAQKCTDQRYKRFKIKSRETCKDNHCKAIHSLFKQSSMTLQYYIHTNTITLTTLNRVLQHIGLSSSVSLRIQSCLKTGPECWLWWFWHFLVGLLFVPSWNLQQIIHFLRISFTG